MKGDCLLVLDNLFSMAKAIETYTIFSCHQIHQVLDAEKRLSECWTDFEALTNHEWCEVRTSVDDIRSGYLLVYGMRMAFVSVRANSKVGIWHGLMGITIDNDILDYRDVLSVANLLYDAAVRLEAEPEPLFQRGLRYATPKRRQLLEAFLIGPEFAKSIRSKGFEAAGAGSDFVYKCSTA